jgi:PAS domain S-box-containing protein
VPLLLRLFLLIAAALMPTVLIQGYNELALRRSRQIEVRDQALSLAKLAAAEQQQIIQGIREVLIALSELPAIRTKDIPSCQAYLAAIKKRYPAFLSIIAADTTGEFFCSTITDNQPVNDARRAFLAEVIKTGGFTVGRYSVGRESGRRILQFAMPFYDNNQHVAGVVLAGLSLDWLAQYIGQMNIPLAGAITIADGDGTILARYPDNSRFVGRRLTTERPMETDDSGTADLVDVDGVARILGYATLRADSGAILVSVGIDKARAFTEIESHTRHDIALIVCGISLVLILTWVGARRFIHQPLGQLVDAASRWQLGDYSRPTSISKKHSELARVGEAFNAMADALQDREHALRKAKEVAEQAASRVTAFLDSTTDSVVIVDRLWRISYLNERARKQLSGDQNLVGRSLWSVCPGTMEAKVYDQYQRAMSEQRAVSFERFSDRLKAWLRVNVFPFSQGLTIYYRDITEHKAALEARRALEEQLRQSQKMEAVGQLTGGVAHDFNNLLMAVAGYLTFIEENATDKEQVGHFAAAARRAVDSGAKLTAQLLAFSRRQTLKPAVVHVDRLIRDFDGLLRQAVGSRCELQVTSHPQLWACYIDAAQLETALLNLVLNGRDAMPNDGVIKIEARNVAADRGAINGLAPGSYVGLSVTDNGCGMSQEAVKRAFEPFYTTKPTGEGTGLGLSMVYGFVRQSGGHVTIKSVVDAGTTVTLYLPRTERTSDDADADRARIPPPIPERILVVDDDEQILRITSTMLISLGYNVLSARDGAEALRILRNDASIGLLLSDVRLQPGIDGVELARAAKQQSQGIKVLLTSGYADDILERHQASDEFPLIRKPFSKTDLVRRLWSVMIENGTAMDPPG